MPDLWDEICTAASAFTKEREAEQRRAKRVRAATPVDPTEQRAIERALIETLMGGISAQWTDDAVVYVLHHWQCLECGSEGTFPNIERGRLIRRHNRQGTSWTCHDPRCDASHLPREFQHHTHEVCWCMNCIQETNTNQHTMPLPLMPRMSRGSGHHFIAMRSRIYV